MLEIKGSSHIKFAQAMHDSAIKNINEDIYSIHGRLSSIIQDLPIHIKKELSDVREEITCLGKALEIVPKEFDSSFQEKIDLTINIISEVESHTKKLERTLKTDISKAISDDLKSLFSKHMLQVNNTMNNNFIISKGGIALYGLIAFSAGSFFVTLALYLFTNFLLK